MKTLALINKIDDIKDILSKAVEICKNDILEIMYVHEEEHFSLLDIFKSDEDERINKDAIKKQIQEALKELKYTKDVAILIYVNDTYSHVEATQKKVNPLIVSKLNEATGKLIESDFKILYMKNSPKEYKNIAIVVNLDDSDSRNIDFVLENFKDAKITLIYDYVHIVSLETIDMDPLIGAGYDPVVDEVVTSAKKHAFEELKNSYKLEGVFLEDFNIPDNLMFYVNENKNLDLLVASYRDIDVLEHVKVDCLSLI